MKLYTVVEIVMYCVSYSLKYARWHCSFTNKHSNIIPVTMFINLIFLALFLISQLIYYDSIDVSIAIGGLH